MPASHSDPFCRLPLFYYVDDSRLLISREPKFVHQLIPRPGFDRLGWAQWLTLGLPIGQHTLHEGRQADAAEAAHQGIPAQAVAGHGAAPSVAAMGRAGAAAGVRAASIVRIRLYTSSDMPMSMEMPATVRTSQ